MLARLTKLLFITSLLSLTACSLSLLSSPKPGDRLSDVRVELHEATMVEGELMRVTAIVHNQTHLDLELDKDGIYLRKGSDGIVAQARGAASEPFVLGPYQKRTVTVSFADDGGISTTDLFLVVGGARFVGAKYPSILGEIHLEGVIEHRKAKPAATEPSKVPAGAAEPPPTPAHPHTVGIDLSRLTEHDFDHLEGSRLERRLVARLVQDGFAVVAATERPTTLVVVTAESDSIVLDVRGEHGSRTRAIDDAGQERDALHQEIAQKCSALVHATAHRAPPAAP